MEYINVAILAGVITGGSTILGGLLFLIKNQKIQKTLQSINADFIIGLMIIASAFSLIIPAYKDYSIGIAEFIFSIISGFLFIYFIQIILKYYTQSVNSQKFLFILAMMAHNFPEGLASGASSHKDYSVLSAIAIQNIPEGLITTLSFLSIGLTPLIAFLANALTGLIEIFGALLGSYFGVKTHNALPFLMGFAGGSMLYVSLKELYDRIMAESVWVIVKPSFISGGILMFLLSLI